MRFRARSVGSGGKHGAKSRNLIFSAPTFLIRTSRRKTTDILPNSRSRGSVPEPTAAKEGQGYQHEREKRACDHSGVCSSRTWIRCGGNPHALRLLAPILSGVRTGRDGFAYLLSRVRQWVRLLRLNKCPLSVQLIGSGSYRFGPPECTLL